MSPGPQARLPEMPDSLLQAGIPGKNPSGNALLGKESDPARQAGPHSPLFSLIGLLYSFFFMIERFVIAYVFFFQFILSLGNVVGNGDNYLSHFRAGDGFHKFYGFAVKNAFCCKHDKPPPLYKSNGNKIKG